MEKENKDERLLSETELRAILTHMYFNTDTAYCEKRRKGDYVFGLTGRIVICGKEMCEAKLVIPFNKIKEKIDENLIADAVGRSEYDLAYENAKKEYDEDCKKYDEEVEKYDALPWYKKIFTLPPQTPTPAYRRVDRKK